MVMLVREIIEIAQWLKKKFKQLLAIAGTCGLGISEAMLATKDTVGEIEGIPPSLYILLFGILLVNLIFAAELSPSSKQDKANEILEEFSEKLKNLKLYINNNREKSALIAGAAVAFLTFIATGVAPAIIPIVIIAALIFIKDIYKCAKRIAIGSKDSKSSSISKVIKISALVLTAAASVMLIGSLNGVLENLGISGNIFSTGAEGAGVLPTLLIMAIFAASAYGLFKAISEPLVEFVESFNRRKKEVLDKKIQKEVLDNNTQKKEALDNNTQKVSFKDMVAGRKVKYAISITLTLLSSIGITFLPMDSLYSTILPAIGPVGAIIAIAICAVVTAVVTLTAAARLTRKTMESFQGGLESAKDNKSSLKSKTKTALATVLSAAGAAVTAVAAATAFAEVAPFIAILSVIAIFLVTFMAFMSAIMKTIMPGKQASEGGTLEITAHQKSSSFARAAERKQSATTAPATTAPEIEPEIEPATTASRNK